MISAVERGATNISIGKVVALCDALGVRLESMVVGSTQDEMIEYIEKIVISLDADDRKRLISIIDAYTQGR